MGIGSGPTAAGIHVTPERAAGVPAVFAALQVISQDIARTPIKLRQQVAPDTFMDATDHPLWEILADLSNPETTAYSLKDELTYDVLTQESAYAEIIRDSRGVVTALWRLDPTRMFVDRDGSRRKRYRYTDERGKTSEWLFDASRPPIFELHYRSPIRRCPELMATCIALQRYVGGFFGSGGRPPGLLYTDNADVDEDQAAAIAERWRKWRNSVDRSHETPVLSAGLKYQSMAPVNSEAQLNETAEFLKTEVAGVFRLAPYKLGSLAESNYANIEMLAIEHASSTMDPIFVLWEQAIRRDLLTTRQFGRYQVHFDRNALIRSDMKTLFEALSKGRDGGFYSINDARKKLGENPIDPAVGDVYNTKPNPEPRGQDPGDSDGQA